MVRLIDADKLLAFMKAETVEFRSYVSEYVMTDADRARLDEMTMNQALLVFNAYETLKEHYGEKVLIQISLLDKEDNATYHSTEYAVLKPLPEKTENIEGFDDIDLEWQADSYCDGWNACIDEILGE